MLGWIFIATILLTIIHKIHIYYKINSMNLTIETLTTHNNRNTQPSDTHEDPRRDMTKMLKRL